MFKNLFSNIITLIVGVVIILYLSNKMKGEQRFNLFNENEPEPATMSLDSVKDVLKLITDEVFISVNLNMKNNYYTQRYFLFETSFTKLDSTLHKNEAAIKYKVKFSMGYDLTDKVTEYYNPKTGVYRIPKLEKDIAVMAKEVERFKIKEMGDFTFKQIDSLDRAALRMAEDSLNFYLFRVKIIKQRPVITHRKL